MSRERWQACRGRRRRTQSALGSKLPGSFSLARLTRPPILAPRRYCYLQQPSAADVTDFILDQFDLLHRTYMADRHLIPPGECGRPGGVAAQWRERCPVGRPPSPVLLHQAVQPCSRLSSSISTAALFPPPGRLAGRLVEVAFADLDGDPLGTLRHIYSSLSLGGFASVQPAVESYCSGLELSGFKKNAHRPLSPQLRQRVLQRWRQFYLDFGYPLPDCSEGDEGNGSAESEEHDAAQQHERLQQQRRRPPKQQ